MDHEIRVAQPADAAAVGELLELSYPALMASAYAPESLAPALGLITRANPALLGSGTYYVAQTPAGMLVGCGGWTPEQPGTGSVAPHVAHLRHFATHPEWIRRGVGRAIYRLCEAGARSAGVRTLECYSSLNGEKFYATLGFARVREIDAELRGGVTLRSVLMRRELLAD